MVSLNPDGHANAKDVEKYRLEECQLYERIEEVGQDTAIVVDFDETLWLRNSTEFFLASLKPSLWVAMILQIMGFIKPWKVFNRNNSSAYRDLYRIKCALFLVPNAVKQWEKAAQTLGPELINEPLYERLQKHGLNNVYIASYGFDFIIAPLLKAVDPSLNLIVSSTLTRSAELKIEGKACAVGRVIGTDVLASSVTITDSDIDKDLLDSSRIGALIEWPSAEYSQAGISPMLPFVYLKKIKRPDEKYFTRAIIGHDYITLLLAFALFSDQPILCAIGLFFFLLSYFTAYETSYYENDLLGLKYEDNPKISQEFIDNHNAFVPKFAWAFSMILALIGSFIVVGDEGVITSYGGLTGNLALLAIFTSFMLFLVFVRLVFAWFNRIRVKGRIVPMLLLQLARTAGYLLFFSTSLMGELLLVSLAFAKWIPYLVYRFGGDRTGFPSHLLSFIIFTTFMLVFSHSNHIELSKFFDAQAIIIYSYLLLRTSIEMWSFRRHMTTIYKS